MSTPPTLEQFAEAARMNELQIGHIERGASDPKLSTILKLARALKVGSGCSRREPCRTTRSVWSAALSRRSCTATGGARVVQVKRAERYLQRP